MGQYHILYNIDKNESVTPHKIGLGLKQVEHTYTVASLADVLYMLLTASLARGGGDLDTSGESSDFKVFGRWCGDRVVVLGDYTENSDIPGVENVSELYGNDNDITDQIIPAFEVDFDAKINTNERGWRERKLDQEEWSWLINFD